MFPMFVVMASFTILISLCKMAFFFKITAR